ncbi:MAG: hypothetical protein EA386_05485 [Rhodobacteraceae bacterium]|nr:MAG: hypothetical protein EA386_05485 [Paracoccaceae bacterium]
MMSDPSGNYVSTDAAGLLDRVRAEGALVLIVGLDVDFVVHGELESAQIEAQDTRIDRASSRVAARLSEGAVLNPARMVPFMTVRVDEADLQALLSMQGIDTIRESITFDLDLSESTAHVDARRLWVTLPGLRASGHGQAIAVLDSGVWRGHLAFFDPQFNTKIPASACFSNTEQSATHASTCPNGETSQITPFSGVAGVDCDPDTDGCGHGTHVAAIAGGHLGNPPMSHGMARDADIIPINVFRQRDNCGSNPQTPCIGASWTDVQLGLEQAVNWQRRNNIAVVNMSLGTGTAGPRFDGECDDAFPGLAAVANNLRSLGVAVIATTGNGSTDGAIGAPACISSIMAVGNTTLNDAVWTSSNHHSTMPFLAPGTGINAADSSQTQPAPRRALTTKTGTSMAAPHVAGAFAMLRSFRPSASVTAIERALACTGIPVARDHVAKPRISMTRARNYMRSPDLLRGWGFGTEAQVMAWRDVLGERDQQGNSLRLRPDGSSNWAVASAPWCANDVVFTAQMRRLDPDRGFAWNSGLYISSVADDEGVVNGLRFVYNIFPDGRVNLSVWAGERENLATGAGGAQVLCSDFSQTASLGTPQVLQAIKQGNRIRFRFNGYEVCSDQIIEVDSRFRFGHVAVTMAAPTGAAADDHQLNLIRAVARPLIQRDPTPPSAPMAAYQPSGDISGLSEAGTPIHEAAMVQPD